MWRFAWPSPAFAVTLLAGLGLRGPVPVQHDLRKRILRRLRAEGIEIPFPTRAVELRPPGTAPGV